MRNEYRTASIAWLAAIAMSVAGCSTSGRRVGGTMPGEDDLGASPRKTDSIDARTPVDTDGGMHRESPRRP